VRRLCRELLGLTTDFGDRIGALDREVRERARADEMARHPMAMPRRGLPVQVFPTLKPMWTRSGGSPRTPAAWRKPQTEAGPVKVLGATLICGSRQAELAQ